MVILEPLVFTPPCTFWLVSDQNRQETLERTVSLLVSAHHDLNATGKDAEVCDKWFSARTSCKRSNSEMWKGQRKSERPERVRSCKKESAESYFTSSP